MGIMVGGENENGRGRKKVVGGQNFEKVVAVEISPPPRF